MVYEAIALIGAAVTAGISYNTLGIWKRYREGGDAAIDWAKVKKNVIIGSVLGVIGWGVSLTKQLPIPEVASVDSFALAVIGFFPLIVVADAIFTNHELGSNDDGFSFDSVDNNEYD